MDSSPRLNVAAMANRSRSVSVILGLTLATTVLLACVATSSQAAITWTGNVSPSDPNKWTSSIFVYIGESSTGEIKVDDSSILLSYSGYVGYNSGSTGSVTVTGTGSKWTNSRNLYVGYDGSGTLTVSDGGSVDAGGGIYSSLSNLSGDGTILANGGVLDADLVFDAAHGSQDSLIFGSGGILTITPSENNELGVGYKGAGTLRIADGVSFTTLTGLLGYYPGTTGTAVVTGTDTKWTTLAHLYVGRYGSGALTVSDGGSVVVGGGIYSSLSNLSGDGTILANGGVLDADLVFDAAHPSQNSFHFGSGGTLTITPSANSSLGCGYNSMGTLRIADGVKVVSRGILLGDQVGSTGTAVVTGSGSMWNGSNGNTCDVGMSGTGILTIEEGGQVNCIYSYLGINSGSSGSVTVTGSNSTWTNSNALYVGNSGTGTVTIKAGGQVSSFGGILGKDSGSIGRVIVIGSGSKWTNYGLSVGNSGTGLLTIEAGGQVSTGGASLGEESGSSGTLTVTGGNSTLTSGELNVGNSGKGTLTIEAGGQVSNTYGYLGHNPGSTGSVMVTGPGSKWTNSSSLYVGNSGTGTLIIENGGQVNNTSGYLGYDSGVTGSVTVTGSDSRWANSGNLYVGYNGNGVLTVNDGGTVIVEGGIYASKLFGNGSISAKGGIVDVDLVFDAAHGSQGSAIFGSNGTLTITQASTNELGVGYQETGTLRIADGVAITSSNGFLGYNAGSEGMAIVTGSSTTWKNSGSIYVGNSGTGTLTIEAGGQVRNYHGYLGYNSGSSGSVTVTGNGSKWTNDNLYVGRNGCGVLTVNDGGMVIVSGVIYTSLSSLFGNGTITANGGILDADLVFDAAHGSQCSVIFGSGGTLTITPSEFRELGVGYKNTGTLRIADGVTVTSSSGLLGYNAGSTGTATVTGSGSMWTTSNVVVVGFSGNGALTIEDGGQVSNRYRLGYIGYKSGSTGTVKVTGIGSTWTCGALYNGWFGAGTLTIEDGGQVSDTGGFIGLCAGSASTVTVKGAGSTWINSDALFIGDSGKGTLTIEDGGQVSNVNGFIGNSSSRSYSGTGLVTVTGRDSKWTTSADLYVGRIGTGTLNIGSGIASGGVVVAKNVIITDNSVATGICNLNGGTLQVGTLYKGSGTATFNWNDGTIRSYVHYGLAIGGYNSLTLKLAATGTHAFDIDADSVGSVSAVLCDATSGGTLTKLGKGTLTLSAANTYTGKTTISAGILSLYDSGSLASALIDVQSGATFDVRTNYSLGSGKTLTGSGTVVGNLSVSGIHAPGNSVGIETVIGKYSLLGVLQIELAGTTAGSGYDQVLQSGSSAYSTTLSGSLALDWTGFGGSVDSTKLWILKNDTAGALSGTFGNYANGASLGVHDGRSWCLYYGANFATGSLTGGNDVVISAVPEPGMMGLLGIFAMGVVLVGWRRRR